MPRGRSVGIAVPFLDQCGPCATAFGEVFRYGPLGSVIGRTLGRRLGMFGNVMSDGRLLSLQATEWLILIVGGLAGSLILMF
jgi:hypothetical protein